jgi:predicted alpha/beta hydrolase family esterase
LRHCEPDRPPAPRVLVIPGLNDSGPAHWQTWLQSVRRDVVRVRQRDWARPDVDAWAAEIEETMARAGGGAFFAAAHSFGCLALAHLLGRRRGAPVVSALLVAPADPVRFGLENRLHASALPCRSTLVASETDPWMALSEALRWAGRWGCHVVNLGDAGHINAEAGYGPLPLAAQWLRRTAQLHHRRCRLERSAVSA